MATDNDDEEETDNHEDTREAIREALENATDVNAALAHRFEYHIFHAGEVHRIGRIDCRDVYSMIGEWMKTAVRKPGGNSILMTPVFLFMDGTLWTVLKVQELYSGKAICTETSIPMGVVHRAIVEHDPRVIEW